MTDTDEPKKQLLAGIEILDPVLTPYGFRFRLESQGKGSGGPFASGSYRQGDRRLELHFRGSLGLVTCHMGSDSLDHETYLRLLGVHAKAEYPDFPADPLESFANLAKDIKTHCADFLSGDGQSFHSLADTLAKNPSLFKGVP